MTQPEEEPPPFFGTWQRIYAFVLVYLVVIIVLFYTFERIFA